MAAVIPATNHSASTAAPGVIRYAEEGIGASVLPCGGGSCTTLGGIEAYALLALVPFLFLVSHPRAVLFFSIFFLSIFPA